MGKQHTKEEVQARTTKRILAALEGGKIPWNNPVVIKGLHDGMSFNSTTDRRYNGGMNIILLWLAAAENGWADPRWMGRRQAQKAGLSIKGLTNAKGTMIFAPILKRFKNDDGEWVKYCKGFREVTVWNAQQVEDHPGLEEQYEIPEVDEIAGFVAASDVLNASGAKVRHSREATPCYVPAMDEIRMPKAGQFDSLDAYWSTMMHELTHWTGGKPRLDRGMFGKGKAAYAYEELVAEMGSAFLCSWLGVDKPAVTKNHEAYIQSWIQALGNDKTLFMDAAGKAWKAFTLLTKDQ